jgi:rod shape-determining protein MreD
MGMGRKQLIVVAKVLLLLVLAVILQTVLLSQISILGVTADLVLILTVIVAVSRGSLEGAVFGFFAGILADIAYYQPLGVRAFVYVLVGYFVGMFVARFGTVSPWSVALLAGVASFLAQFVFGLVEYVTGPRGGFFTIIGTQMLPQAVLDGLITAPLYVFLVRVRLIPAGHLETAGPRGGEE